MDSLSFPEIIKTIQGNFVLDGELLAGINNEPKTFNDLQQRLNKKAPSEKFIKTGLQFCGLMMGDHSKCAINTMFNTGTVVGVNANIFGAGFPRNFIPSFSWGGAKGFKTYSTEKAFEVASIVLSRRGLEFNALEAEILNHVFELTKDFRKNT